MVFPFSSTGTTKEHDGEYHRISSLPDDLLGHIISFLPIREAVTTSILSHRWRYFWTSCSNVMILTKKKKHLINQKDQQQHHPYLQPQHHPNLVNLLRNFDIFYYPSPDDFEHPPPISIIFELPPQFKTFNNLKILYISYLNLTNHTLNTLLSTSPFLEKFTLFSCYARISYKYEVYGSSFYEDLPSDFNISYPHTSLTTIEFFHVSLSSLTICAPLPSLEILELRQTSECNIIISSPLSSLKIVKAHYLSNLTISSPLPSLEILKVQSLSNITISAPLPSLKIFEFRFYKRASVSNLSISTPLLSLKILEVHDCSDLDSLVVNAPNIRSLIYGHKNFRGLSPKLRDLLSDLEDVNFLLSWKSFEKPDLKEFTALAQNLTSFKRLSVSNWLTQLAYHTRKCKNSHIAFSILKEFHWHGKLDNQYDIVALSTFLGNLPSLQKLCIKICESTVNWFYTRKEKKNFLQHLDYELHELKTIEIMGILPSSKEMILVNFLLNKAVVLESMLLTCELNGKGLIQQIRSHSSWNSQKQKSLSHLPPNLQLQEILSELPRTSAHAKIMLLQATVKL